MASLCPQQQSQQQRQLPNGVGHQVYQDINLPVAANHPSTHPHYHADVAYSALKGIKLNTQSMHEVMTDINNSLSEIKFLLLGSFARTYWVRTPDLHPAQLFPFFNSQNGNPRNVSTELYFTKSMLMLEFGSDVIFSKITIAFDYMRSEILFERRQQRPSPPDAEPIVTILSLDQLMLKYVFSNEEINASNELYNAIADVSTAREIAAYLPAFSHLITASKYILNDNKAIASKPLCLSDKPDCTDDHRSAAILAIVSANVGPPDMPDNTLALVDLLNKRYSSVGGGDQVLSGTAVVDNGDAELAGLPLGTQAFVYSILTEDSSQTIAAFRLCFRYLFPIVAGDVPTQKLKRHLLLFSASHSRDSDLKAIQVVEVILREELSIATVEMPMEYVTLAASSWVKYFAPHLLMRCITDVHASIYVSLNHTLQQTAILVGGDQNAKSATLARLKFGCLLSDASAAIMTDATSFEHISRILTGPVSRDTKFMYLLKNLGVLPEAANVTELDLGGENNKRRLYSETSVVFNKSHLGLTGENNKLDVVIVKSLLSYFYNRHKIAIALPSASINSLSHYMHDAIIKLLYPDQQVSHTHDPNNGMDDLYNRTSTVTSRNVVGGNMGFGTVNSSSASSSISSTTGSQSNSFIHSYDVSAWVPYPSTVSVIAASPPSTSSSASSDDLPDKLTGAATALFVVGAGIAGAFALSSSMGWLNTTQPITLNPYYIAMNEMYNREQLNQKRMNKK